MGSKDTEINWTKEYRHQPTSSEQTLAQRRERPYIWTTWLPRLLTGENSCEWAIWFKAHHQNWAKVPSDFNQAEWMLNHTSLLNEKKSQVPFPFAWLPMVAWFGSVPIHNYRPFLVSLSQTRYRSNTANRISATSGFGHQPEFGNRLGLLLYLTSRCTI